MKKELFFAALLLFSLQPLAQEREKPMLVIKYKFTHVVDTTQPQNPVVQHYLLYEGASFSKYVEFNTAMYEAGTPVTEVIRDDNGNEYKSVLMASDKPLYKKLSTQKMTTEYSYFSTAYLVEEPLPKLNWEMMKETKNIKGYQCQKAMTDYKGRRYEAWFAAGFPIADGPWKFTGLPGLILEVSDLNRQVVFEFVELNRAGKETPMIGFAGNASFVTKQQYAKLAKAIQQDKNAMRGAAAGAELGTVSVSNVPISASVSSSAPAAKPRRFNNPIERKAN
jgi:GLPGLI family protein